MSAANTSSAERVSRTAASGKPQAPRPPTSAATSRNRAPSPRRGPPRATRDRRRPAPGCRTGTARTGPRLDPPGSPHGGRLRDPAGVLRHRRDHPGAQTRGPGWSTRCRTPGEPAGRRPGRRRRPTVSSAPVATHQHRPGAGAAAQVAARTASRHGRGRGELTTTTAHAALRRAGQHARQHPGHRSGIGTGPGQQSHPGQGLDVLHHGRPPVHPADGGRPRGERRQRGPAVQGPFTTALASPVRYRSGPVTIRTAGSPEPAARRSARAAAAIRCGAAAPSCSQTTAAGAERLGGADQPVDHQVWAVQQQGGVLGAGRFALGAVGHHQTRLPRRARAARHFAATGKCAPPRPVSSACSIVSQQPLAGRAGGHRPGP